MGRILNFFRRHKHFIDIKDSCPRCGNVDILINKKREYSTGIGKVWVYKCNSCGAELHVTDVSTW